MISNKLYDNSGVYPSNCCLGWLNFGLGGGKSESALFGPKKHIASKPR
jgi:hypothetical protein